MYLIKIIFDRDQATLKGLVASQNPKGLPVKRATQIRLLTVEKRTIPLSGITRQCSRIM